MFPTRPSTVRISVVALLLTEAFALGDTIVKLRAMPTPIKSSIYLLVSLAILLTAWLAYMTWTGRNWARITQLVIVVYGALTSFPSISSELSNDISTGAISILLSAIQLSAVWLLFQAPASAWFDHTRSP
jgi:hypothetical protein